MKAHSNFLVTGLFAVASFQAVQAQYAPPPPPAPFQGFINEALRKDDPAMSKWDIGGSFRGRYEVKDNFGMSGVGVAGPPNTLSLDFRAKNADVDNDYWLQRIRLRAGYTEPWWGALVEGESSLAESDARYAYPNSPPVAGTTKR